MTVMFGALGFATDLGWNYFLKTRVQTAADAGASAAAIYAANNADTCSTITCGVTYTCAGTTPPTTSLQSGCLYATVDGPPVLVATMIENNAAHPPAGLSGVTPTMWIKATVTASNSNHFLFLSGFHTASILASSIAGITTTASSGNGSCIYALSSNGTGITDSGSGNITTSCGIADNGGLAYSASGNIRAVCTSPARCPIYVNGNLSDNSSGNISSSTSINVGGTVSGSHSGTISPSVTAGTTTVADPFANVTPPPVGPCTTTNYSFTSATSPTSPLQPGVYCGGMSFSGSGNVSFAPGTYIINGTDANGKSFDYTGSGNLTGTGVTFFITGQGGYSAGPINIAASGNTFSAPSSGSYQGLLFYQDPGVSYATANNYSGSGNTTGSLYFKTTTLDYSGSGNALSQALVASKIVFTGSGNFTQDTTGTLTGINKSTTSVSLVQ
jgi:hypothetical protein